MWSRTLCARGSTMSRTWANDTNHPRPSRSGRPSFGTGISSAILTQVRPSTNGLTRRNCLRRFASHWRYFLQGFQKYFSTQLVIPFRASLKSFEHACLFQRRQRSLSYLCLCLIVAFVIVVWKLIYCALRMPHC